MDVHIRLANQRSDIDFAERQALREGWDSTREVFEVCLKHDREGFFIAECEGEPWGLVTAMRLVDTGWVGNLIVVPPRRRHGIGKALFTQALVYLRHPGIRAVRLEATPSGADLYRRFAFLDEFESLRFRSEDPPPTGAGSAEPLTPDRLPAVAEYDAARFGDRRGRLLRLLLKQARAAFVERDGDAVQGYIMVWPTPTGTRIGPWVADDVETADRLLRAALSEHGSGSVVIGVPGRNHAAAELLDGLGFSQSTPCIRMVWGEPVGEVDANRVFGIANGAMG